jgi:hypothetical protein
MSHRNAVTCDGKAHFGHFVVDQVETSQFGDPLSPLNEELGLGVVLPLRRELPENGEASMPFVNDGFHPVR